MVRKYTISCWVCRGSGVAEDGSDCPRCLEPLGRFALGRVQVVLARDVMDPALLGRVLSLGGDPDGSGGTVCPLCGEAWGPDPACDHAKVVREHIAMVIRMTRGDDTEEGDDGSTEG